MLSADKAKKIHSEFLERSEEKLVQFREDYPDLSQNAKSPPQKKNPKVVIRKCEKQVSSLGEISWTAQETPREWMPQISPTRTVK
jgi:hypothetical protein